MTALRALASTALALLLCVVMVTPAAAATSIKISGSVACQSGEKVVGIWVQSSNGGSNWASWSARSGAAWIADYTFTIQSSKASTTVELHVGCGNSGANWLSNNRYKVGTISGTTAVSVICNDVAKVTTFSCRAWPTTVVLVGMPFTGRVNGDATTHTKYSGHDIAEDVYGAAGTKARIWAFAPRGVAVTMTVSKPTTGVCGTMNITVKAGGVVAGTLHLGHLVADGTIKNGGTIANGALLGTTKQWPKTPWNGNCAYLVTDKTGVHTHMALTSNNAWACIAAYSGTRSEGTWIGMLGKTAATKAQQACPMK